MNEDDRVELVAKAIDDALPESDNFTLAPSQIKRAAIAAITALQGADTVTEAMIERTRSGETVNGFAVAAYRETHPEHGACFGHSYSEHWSTPSKDPRVKVERLFTESQLLAAMRTAAPTAQDDTGARLDADWKQLQDDLAESRGEQSPVDGPREPSE